jgi:hypothetical protein
MALVSGPTLGDAIADPGQRPGQARGERGGRREADRRALHARPEPALHARRGRRLPRGHQAIEADHRRLVEALGKREVEVALERPRLERERLAAVEKAKAALASYEAELAPRVAERERQKAAEVARLDADLKAYEAGLAGKVAEWEKAQSAAVRWVPLIPSSLKASNGATLTKEADGVDRRLRQGRRGGDHDRRRDRPRRGHGDPARAHRRRPDCLGRGRGGRPTATSCSTSSR